VLVDFLRANADIFAWSPTDMLGIPREVAEHSLDIRAGSKPVKQRLRRFDKEKLLTPLLDTYPGSVECRLARKGNSDWSAGELPIRVVADEETAEYG